MYPISASQALRLNVPSAPMDWVERVVEWIQNTDNHKKLGALFLAVAAFAFPFAFAPAIGELAAVGWSAAYALIGTEIAQSADWDTDCIAWLQSHEPSLLKKIGAVFSLGLILLACAHACPSAAIATAAILLGRGVMAYGTHPAIATQEEIDETQEEIHQALGNPRRQIRSMERLNYTQNLALPLKGLPSGTSIAYGRDCAQRHFFLLALKGVGNAQYALTVYQRDWYNDIWTWSVRPAQRGVQAYLEEHLGAEIGIKGREVLRKIAADEHRYFALTTSSRNLVQVPIETAF